MFLTQEELQELTDFKTARSQCRWLTAHGYPFDKSASGKPKVLRVYLTQRLGIQSTLPRTNEHGFLTQPDFSAFE